MAAKLVSSKSETRYASAASWSAMTADDWKRRSVYEARESVVSHFLVEWSYWYRHLEVLRDFADEALEGELADEELGRLLVATNFTEGDGSGPEAMGLLHTSSAA